MHSTPYLRPLFRLAAAACLLVAATAQAAPVEITRAFSGVWDQPDHQSQGFVLQIADSEDDGKIGVAYWFTYDEDLTPAWYLGVGPVDGNEIDMVLYEATGIAFLETGIEGNPNVAEIGTLLMSFSNCNQGTAAFDTPPEALGSGEVRIKRLTSLYRMRCSGGISDDTPSDARPLQLEVELLPPEAGMVGEGKAKFWERPGRSDLKVTVEDLPDGTYTLEVCEEEEGSFEVTNGEGNLQFRSPAIPGKELLDFVPTDCRFDIFGDGGLALTSGDAVLAPKARGNDDDGEGEEENEIEVDLDNTGVLPGARGSASWEQDDDRTSFKVKIRNLPVGDYPLHVGGVEVGLIEVTEHNAVQNRGELRFSEPRREDDEPLTFDPLGATIEIYDGGDIILEVLFPDA